MNKILAALVAATFSFGAFAQASAPAPAVKAGNTTATVSAAPADMNAPAVKTPKMMHKAKKAKKAHKAKKAASAV